MEEVELTTKEGVALLTLAAPDRRNALTPDMARSLIDACDTIDGDPAIGALVVRSLGHSFCAGAHRETLSAVARDPALHEAFNDLDVIYESFARVGRLKVPSVAAVAGHAVGAGVNLVLAADLCVIADDAKLIPGFLQLGIHPGGGHFTLACRAGGRGLAVAMGLFGEVVDAELAVKTGIAWNAVPRSDVEARALELAAKVAADPELARRATHVMRTELGPPSISWPAAIEVERATQMWSLRRRSPTWEGQSA